MTEFKLMKGFYEKDVALYSPGSRAAELEDRNSDKS